MDRELVCTYCKDKIYPTEEEEAKAWEEYEELYPGTSRDIAVILCEECYEKACGTGPGTDTPETPR